MLRRMKVITLNANGIRAAERKGFFDWLRRQDADFVCIQETKAQHHQLKDRAFFPPGFHVYYHDAVKPGYSGTAIYSRHQPDRVRYGLGWSLMDGEGRWLQADIGNLTVVSLYFPSGSSSEARQAIKFRCMDHIRPRLVEMAASGRDVMICGDWNIAHRKIDLKNWRGNQKQSGFLPEEREWMGQVFGEVGLADAFRQFEPGEHQYTWWSNRGQAWANNTGWRIDYHVTTPGLAERVTAVDIYKDERFSDHAPLTLEYDYDLPARELPA